MTSFARSSQMNSSTIEFNHPLLFSLTGLLTVFGLLPLLLAIALTTYAYHIAWFSGIVFGVAWIVNIIVFVSLIWWANQTESLFHR